MWRLLLGTMGVKSLVQGLNAAATAGFEPKTVWSEVRRRNRFATAPFQKIEIKLGLKLCRLTKVQKRKLCPRVLWFKKSSFLFFSNCVFTVFCSKFANSGMFHFGKAFFLILTFEEKSAFFACRPTSERLLQFASCRDSSIRSAVPKGRSKYAAFRARAMPKSTLWNNPKDGVFDGHKASVSQGRLSTRTLWSNKCKLWHHLFWRPHCTLNREVRWVRRDTRLTIRVTVWGRGLCGTKSQRVQRRIRCRTQPGLSPVPERTDKLNIFIDPIVSARKKVEKRDRHEEREREREKEISLSLFMSISLLRLFSRAHYLVNKYILKMRVSSKELFSTLKNWQAELEACTTHVFLLDHRTSCTVFRAIVVFPWPVCLRLT